MVQVVKTDCNAPLVLQVHQDLQVPLHPQDHQVPQVLRQTEMDRLFHKVCLLVNKMVHLVLQDL